MATVAPAMGHDASHPANEGTQWQLHSPEQYQSMDVTSLATCSNGSHKRVKAKRKNDSLSATLCAAIVEHQLGLSINCILLLTLTHLFFPRLRTRTIHYFTLSYHDPDTGLYTQGPDDLKFVALCIVIFTALRIAVMDYLLIPIARFMGINKKKAIIRFAEQGWVLLYYIVFWSLGMYLMSETPYFFKVKAVWENFPTRSMTGLFKWYYLAQFGFWLQQIVVVHIEERRKDHWQMFTHHIITCTLMLFSYGCYQTKVGITILCLMDVVDVILPAAKLLKYVGYQKSCDFMFVVFVFTWMIARHVFYLAVCWSIYADMPVINKYGCYNSVTGEQLSSDGGDSVMKHVMHAYRNNDDEVCFNKRIHYSFLGLLLALQVLTMIWGGMIIRVAYRVVMGSGADDTRSDDEGEEEDEEEAIRDFAEKAPELQYQQALRPQEVEVEAEDMDFARRPSTSKRRSNGSTKRSKGRSSGISIPGAASDHKELLGRIGCDKPA